MMETVSLAAAVVSVIIGGFAIWLSVTFYRMSSKIAEDTKGAAKGISSSVDRLESLFDKLYADTFSMMKDTVSDMRKHIWPNEQSPDADLSGEIEKKADEKVSALRSEVDSELSELLLKQSVAEANIDSLRSEMAGLIDKVISVSRSAEVEAREETIRHHIMTTLRTIGSRTAKLDARTLVRHMMEYPPMQVVQELKNMAEERLIVLTDLDSDGQVRPSTKIQLR